MIIIRLDFLNEAEYRENIFKDIFLFTRYHTIFNTELYKVTVYKHYRIATVIIILLITIQSCPQPGMVQMVFAQSPSFVRQEIIDDSSDWLFWKGASSNKIQLNTHDGNMVEVDRADDSSECGIDENFVAPDIQSVSYVSDGKNLTATVWLTSRFEEPPLNYTIDTFQEELMVTISNTNLTLEEYTVQNMARLPLFSPGFTIEENSTMLSGNRAHEISYTNTTSQGEARITRMWTIDEGKAYEITYSALPSTYNQYLPTVQEMIDTFAAVSSSFSPSSPSIETSLNRSNSNISKGFLLYETPEIRIHYPPDWQYEEQTNSNDEEARTVHFRSPFEDSEFDIPSWREITFTMAIDIDSVLDAGTDYRVIYSRVPSNSWTGYWTKQVREISAYDKIRVVEENKNYTDFYNKQDDSSHILFSFDLSKINLPERYKAAFYITDYFVKGHQFCTLIDTTNWVIIPPPEFTISANPSSVVLRPGEEQNIQLQVKGNTDLQSEAVLTADDSNDPSNDIKVNFFPSNKTSIPPSGSGSYSLNIRTNETAEPRSYTFPIIANISFPTAITNRGGETFNNNKSVSIIESSNLTLTVLPPYTTPELLSNFTEAWITPISGIWTFIAGVGTVVAPLLLYLYRKRKKKKEEE
jgi:hypothetical protein